MLRSEVDVTQLIFWFDAHISPAVAKWMIELYKVKAASLRQLGLRNADDADIFKSARESKVIFVSKDKDLKELIEQNGPPPKLIWLTCGNTSNLALKDILQNNFESIISALVIDDGYFLEITS